MKIFPSREISLKKEMKEQFQIVVALSQTALSNPITRIYFFNLIYKHQALFYSPPFYYLFCIIFICVCVFYFILFFFYVYLISCFFYHLIFYSMAAQTRTGSQRYQKFATTTKRPTGCTRYSQRYFRSAVALSTSYFSQFSSLFSGLASSTTYFLRPRISSAIILFPPAENQSFSLSRLTTFRSFRSNNQGRFPPR